MDEVNIRRALAADAQLLAELSAVTFFDTFKDTCAEEDMQSFIKYYFSLEQLESELHDTNDFYFIAFIDAVAVGYVRLKEEQSEVDIIHKHKGIELKRIYVLTEYHSKKIGAALLKFSFKFAAERNYKLIWLGVWEHNERAKTFYKKFGFEDTGVMHPFPIGNTPQFDNWLYRFIKNE
ncbi:MAG: GNAT family N-acetyltransferase [Ginsengibacter sp.]